MNRIFERFYQLDKSRSKNSGKGVGLGLAISDEIVRAHGGVIHVDSREGQGSIFVVKIPLARHDEHTVARKRM